MTYETALDFIHSRPRFSAKPTLETMWALMEKLGNPQDTLKFVHIAGTNGKGSTAAMTANVLRKAGYKTGLNISPYVLDFCERFAINGEEITHEELASITEKVQNATEIIEKEGSVPPNEFEIVTAIAFLYFAQNHCDIVCLEVGLGGKFDPTNIIKNTLVSCIMKIGLDHTAQLGKTVDLIAAEKAGIIKPNTTVIVYPTQEIKALDVIVKTAKAQKAKLIVPELEDLHLYKGDIFHNVIDYGGYEMNLPFVGEHQAQNACVVVETALELCNKGFDISDEAIIEGIEQTTFPARIEIISKEPLILLDGCHNVDSVTALANTLKKANLPPMVAVIGILEEKEPLALLNILKPYFSTVYTVTPDSPRAMTAEKLASLAKPIFENVFPIGNVKNAIASAKKNIGGKKALCVCGSLYLAAEARKYLKPED